MKYRKKPVVIEATQWFKMGDHERVVLRANPIPGKHDLPMIYSLEGWHIVTHGDWIITGVKGEHYPCKDDIFQLTYELVTD